MKIIKYLIAISLVNAITLVAVVVLGTPARVKTIASTEVTTLPSPSVAVVAQATTKPTPRPAKSASPTVATTKPTTATTTTAPKQTSNPTTAPVVAPTPAPTVAPTPIPAPAGCIIMIDGVKYDVTQFRNMHSGGNVFQCNTDMSAVFWSRHNQAILNRMAQYRI